MTDVDASILVQQNDIIISLLGRLTFPNDKLREIIQKGSKKPNEMLRAYNQCNGLTSVNEIAKNTGVAQQSLAEAIEKWDSLGIVFKIQKGNNTFPQKLYTVV